MNHRCDGGNAFARGVVVEGSSGLVYRVTFFASKDIEALEELTYSYNWEADKAAKQAAAGGSAPFSPGASYRQCKCGSAGCVQLFKF
jgi:SET domain-containing protein